MQRLLSILLFLSLCTSCEKEVQLGVADEFSQLVVISHINPDTTFSVFISATNPSTNPINPLVVTNASVLIFEEEVLLDSLFFSSESNFYKSVRGKPKAGKSYTIDVGIGNNPNRTIGVSRIPEPNPVLSAWISNVEKRSVDNIGREIEYTFTLEILLNNSAGVNPFTHLEFFRNIVLLDIQGNDTSLVDIGQPQQLNILNTPNALPYLIHFDYGVLISGKNNTSPELKYTFQVQTRLDSRTEALPQIFLNARSISEDYYLYHTTLTRQIRDQDTLFNNPVIVYDNIDNGIGIFAGYSNAVDTIVIR